MASNFSFSRVPDVRVGLGSTGQLADVAKALRVQAPIIITDERIVDLGLLNTSIYNKLSGSIIQ